MRPVKGGELADTAGVKLAKKTSPLKSAELPNSSAQEAKGLIQSVGRFHNKPIPAKLAVDQRLKWKKQSGLKKSAGSLPGPNDVPQTATSLMKKVRDEDLRRKV